MNAQEFLWQMGRVSWQASFLTLLVLLVQWLARDRLSARWRCALWSLVLVRLVVPAMPETRWSVFNWIPLPTRAPQWIRTTDGISAFKGNPRNLMPSNPLEGPGSTTTQVSQHQTERNYKPLSVESALNPQASRGLGFEMPRVSISPGNSGQVSSWSKGLFTLWVCGFGVLLGKALANTIRLNRQLRGIVSCEDPEVVRLLSDCREQMGVKASLEWLETAAVRSPALHGWFRARLLLPVGYARETSREELRRVFLHELAHVKRRDIAVNWLVTVLQFVHWFNPVLWFAFGRYRADRELACDELALEHAGESSVEAYGQSILRLLGAPLDVGVVEMAPSGP